MSDEAGGVSNDPVVASLPTPISVEPRVAPGEAAEVARQADEARIPKSADPAKPAAKVEEKAKPLTIKESLAKAREKIEAEPAKAISVTPKAAEPVAASKDAPVKGAEPAAKNTTIEKTAEPAKAADTAPARAEDGKFVSTKAPAEPVADAKAAPVAPNAANRPRDLPSHTASPPPARFSKTAQEEWAAAPESVRAETERAVKELTQGFEKHRAAAERDAGLAEYHELAAKGGTDVKTALSKYVGMENLIRKDPIAGLHEIAKNAGLNLRDVAAKILNQPADQVRSESDQRVASLEKEIAALKQFAEGTKAERQAAVTNTTTEAVTKFAADNPRFEELSEDIAFFLKSGKTKDLAEAYKLAERLNPAPVPAPVEAAAPVAASSAAPAITKPTLVASSSDAGTKSIAGTPTAGSDPVSKVRSNSIKEAIRRAAARAG